MKEYATVTADEALENDLRALVRLAISEDLGRSVDWTTVCLIEDASRGACRIVPRVAGVCAGLAVLPWIVDEFDADLDVELNTADGGELVPGEPIATLRGSTRDLLTSERTILNILSRMCGVATLTRRYVERIGTNGARLFDTRKTTPGWRRLEKYSVRCGGGHNHRTGLFDGFLIKDNHLALAGKGSPLDAGDAARKAIRWRRSRADHLTAPDIVEVEVDSLDQLRQLLPAEPDIVLIDNFPVQAITQAVRLRDELAPKVELEASGNVTLETIGEIAATGVDRISVGALTHQATWLDLGLDWHQEQG